MKMKTMFSKRRFLAALSVVLLISAALVTSCMDHLGDYEDKQGDNVYKEAPAGKGLIRINITDSNARTILPTLPAVGSMYYSVKFVGGTTVDIGDTTAVAYDKLNNIPIALDIDAYNITITAWKEAARTNPLAGWTGSVGPIGGGTTDVDANLKGWTTDGTGTFRYSINVPALPPATWGTLTPAPTSYSTAKMEISSSSDISLGIGPNTNSSSPLSLSAGYYTVKITLSADNCQDRVVINDMHIYNTEESSWTYSVPALSQNSFSVAFNTNGIPDTGSSFDNTIQDGISNAGTVTDPHDPENDDYDFEGWFTGTTGVGDGTVSGTQWVFGSSGTKVFKDTTLYAKWTAKVQDDITIAAIPGVTPPVAGATPVSAITETAEYTGTVTWDNDNPSTFAPVTTYTATITLTAKQGYTLVNLTTGFFTVSGATTVSYTAGSNTVIAVFPATGTMVINIAAIEGVTAPVAGATPVSTITETAQYTGSVAWNGDPVTFAPLTTYTATIALTPKYGYTLTGVVANFFTVAETASAATNSADSGVITAVFPATGNITINIAAIAGVTAPVAGATPVSTITPTAQYSGSISWSPALVGGKFAPLTAYTATITLTPETGYTLTGVTANFFTVSGATPVNNSADSGVITAEFPATGTMVIDIAAIPGVTVPVAGGIPVVSINPTDQYTGTVTWDNGNPSIFATSTAYTATITLTPKTGYTLTGVGTNFFTVAGATPVSYTAGSNTVTAVFPATASTVTGIDLTITFDLHDVNVVQGGTVTAPITYDKLAGSDTLTFTVNDGYGGVFSGVTWNMDGVSLGSGNTLTLDKNATVFLSKLTTGAHVINVRGTKDGQSFSQNFTLNVNNN